MISDRERRETLLCVNAFLICASLCGWLVAHHPAYGGREAATSGPLARPATGLDDALGGGQVAARPELAASELWRAYDGNEIGADSQYRGREIDVAGMVYRVGRNVEGFAYVTLGTHYEPLVQCWFLAKHECQIGHLRPGQAVTLRGFCQGKGALGIVQIGPCVLLTRAPGYRAAGDFVQQVAP